MPDDASENRDATVADTIERIRAEKFPDVDRDLVLEVLRFHADGVVVDQVDRQIDEAIVERIKGTD
ncbi:MAG: hypothetical protein AAFQ12_05285 [Pseudomonadota bacterium]